MKKENKTKQKKNSQLTDTRQQQISCSVCKCSNSRKYINGRKTHKYFICADSWKRIGRKLNARETSKGMKNNRKLWI